MEHHYEQTQHYEQMQPGEGPVDLDLLGYRSYLMEIEEQEAACRALHEKAEHEGRRICNILDDLAYGGVPLLRPIYGSAFYVGPDDDGYRDVFLNREPAGDIAMLRIPSWPGVSFDLYNVLVQARGIPRLYVVATDPDPRSDGVLVAMRVTDILDPRGVPVVVTCPEAYEETEHRWQRAILL